MITMLGDSVDLGSLNLLSEVLANLKVQRKKGLLSSIENRWLIPKRKRSKLSIRNDLIGFYVPKKKRSDLSSSSSHLNRFMVLKRKRICGDDDPVPSIKRQRTILKGSSSSSSQLPLPHFQEMKMMNSIPIWTFHKKSALRFSLVRLNVSRTTTLVLLDVGVVSLRDVGLVALLVVQCIKELVAFVGSGKSWSDFFNLNTTRPQKVNPVFQLLLVAAALFQPEFGTLETQSYVTYLSWSVASTTLASTAGYLRKSAFFARKC